MELRIIGYWGATPCNGLPTSGYLLIADNKKILIDCGSGVLTELSKQEDYLALDACILTHLHPDHISDIFTLQTGLKRKSRNQELNRPLLIFSPKTPYEVWKLIQHRVFDDIEITNELTYQFGKLKIEFLSVNHTIPCFSVKISDGESTFVYSADTSYYEPLISFASDSDLFLCESTIVSGSKHTSGEGHMDGYEAGKIAQAANVENLILTHLPNDGDLDLILKNAQQYYTGNVNIASRINKIIF